MADPFEETYACNDGIDNDGDGNTDSADSNCDNAWDNSEDVSQGGDPIAVEMDYGVVLDEWSADEDGHTIYYLNAGSYQVNPADSEDFWVLPEEYLAGYAHAKFGAEEFDVLPTLYGSSTTPSFVPYDVSDPSDTIYDETVARWMETLEDWGNDLNEHGLMSEWDGFGLKMEDNQWRPADLSEAGLDRWLEMSTSKFASPTARAWRSTARSLVTSRSSSSLATPAALCWSRKL